MGITVAGLSSSRKTPGVYLNVVLGGPGTSAGTAETRICVVGNMMITALSGAAPALSVAAGNYLTGATATIAPIRIISADDARTRFGAGSELHLMCKAVFEQYPDAPLYACPNTEATAGARAASTLSVVVTSTNPTAAGTLKLVIAGTLLEVPFTTADTVATLVTRIAEYIIAVPELPVTAQYAAGPVSPVTITAKQFGIRGLDIAIRGSILVGTTETELPSQTGAAPHSAPAILGGIEVGICAASVTVTHGIRYLMGGTGDDQSTLATALAALATETYHRIAFSGNTGTAASTSVARVKDWLDTQSGPTLGFRMQSEMATRQALTTADDIPAFANHPRMQLAWHPNSENYLPAVAAQTMAGRLAGDSAAGGSMVGEAADMAANLDGVRLKSVTIQPYPTQIIDPTSIETALNYGLTPLVPSAGRPGYVEIARSITMRWKDDTGAPNFGVLDTTNVCVPDAFAGRLAQEHANTYKGFKLAEDDPEGGPPKTERTTTPSLVRAFIHSLLKDEEAEGRVIQVDDFVDLLKVEPQSGSAWRLNAEIPLVPIPGYHLFAGNVRQLSARL